MTIWNQHPRYQTFLDDWVLCRDSVKGERAVKYRNTVYLPATHSMREDGYPNVNSKGWCDYHGYVERSVFYSFTGEAVKTYLGMLWTEDAEIQLPSKMEDMRENMTRKGESALQLLRNMHEEMLTTGRLGLLADMPKSKTGRGTTGEPTKYITLYKAETIVNWDEGEKDQVIRDSLNLVVLDESGYRRNSDFTWEKRLEYRVLQLGDLQKNEESGEGAVYSQGLFTDNQAFDPLVMDAPTYRGKTLDHIPFVFVNSKDTVPEPDEPPLLSLARLDMTIYRTEADYRQTLFMQGQYTLVITGAGNGVDSTSEGGENTTRKPIRTGAGAVIELVNPAADAKYIGIEGVALPEQREALQNDKRRAEVLSGSLTDTRSNEKESGDAMATRIAGQTASLTSIALTAASALQQSLRSIATWMGLDPEEVIVTANRKFAITKLTPKDLLDLQSFKVAGGPIDDEDVHTNGRRSGFISKSYEDTLEGIANEEPRIDNTGMIAGLPLNPLDEHKMELDETNAELAVDGQDHSKKMDKENLSIAKKAQTDKAKADMVKAKQKPSKPGAKK